MQRALDLARGAQGLVWPNPPVGCVLVKDGRALAEAATHPGGRPHAERAAIEAAGEEARGGTLYVTLEPCCHWGQTPPCTDAIISAGIARVVCAMQDPDPRVNGGGFRRLDAAGVRLSVGLGADAAAKIMAGFLHRTRTGQPLVLTMENARTEIPRSCDGSLCTQGDGLWLQLRTKQGQERRRLSGDMPELLALLGEWGLTTVAVPEDDPCLQVTPAVGLNRAK